MFGMHEYFDFGYQGFDYGFGFDHYGPFHHHHHHHLGFNEFFY